MSLPVKSESMTMSSQKRTRDGEHDDTSSSPTKRLKLRRTTPTGDKVEVCPNNMAACRSCRLRILKGQIRIGRSLQDELTHHSRIAQEHELMQVQRSDLREALRKLRYAFARRMGKPAFLVFEDSALHQFVVHMPTTKEEIFKINGFKEKRYELFREPILEVIRHFQRKYAAPQSHLAVPARVAEPIATFVGSNASRGQTCDDVIVEQTLLCEEIVNRKFQHAAANNYLISID